MSRTSAAVKVLCGLLARLPSLAENRLVTCAFTLLAIHLELDVDLSLANVLEKWAVARILKNS
jgi:hypothetical protein